MAKTLTLTSDTLDTIISTLEHAGDGWGLGDDVAVFVSFLESARCASRPVTVTVGEPIGPIVVEGNGGAKYYIVLVPKSLCADVADAVGRAVRYAVEVRGDVEAIGTSEASHTNAAWRICIEAW